MRKNVPFVWDQKCQNSLDLVKEILTSPPVLVYPDPNEKYHLFTDASNFTWSVTLTQEGVIQTPKGKEVNSYPLPFTVVHSRDLRLTGQPSKKKQLLFIEVSND